MQTPNDEVKFVQNREETILYQSQPIRKWYVLAWKIGIGVFEVVIFLLFSFYVLTGLANSLLASILTPKAAITISQILCQGVVPVLLIAWFAEDTARIFHTRLILTDQRIWTKGAPYAWSTGHETPLSDIRSMNSRRDALFIHLRSTRKIQVYILPDGKQIVNAFTQLRGRTDVN